MAGLSSARNGQREASDSEATLYWYDLETFGLDPLRDRVAQFAGVRTDLSLNILGAPQVFYCKPSADYLPDPYSCLVTGITPQVASRKGLVEAEFIAAIRAEFLVPQTCVVGYNNLRFDDEVIRHTLYRNLFDPYEREWRNGNSRWDIIDMLRLTEALRPEGMNWPATEEGRLSFRLELLTAANGIVHNEAHDALADVFATIELARMIKARQPRLYDYVFEHRGKQPVVELLNLGSFEPLVHVSGRYASERHSLAIILPLTRHPANNNGIIVYDLSIDPAPLIEEDVAAIQRRVFSSASEGNLPRVPLKTVHLNKCPVLAPLKVLRPADYARLGLDREAVSAHLARIRTTPGMLQKVAAIFESPARSEQQDPDVMLYRGGFLDDADRGRLARLHRQAPERWGTARMDFNDPRLPEMVFRFRARNYPETLTPDESDRWEAFRIARLNGDEGDGVRPLTDYRARIEELEASTATDGRSKAILSDLRDYGKQLLGRNRPFLPYT